MAKELRRQARWEEEKISGFDGGARGAAVALMEEQGGQQWL